MWKWATDEDETHNRIRYISTTLTWSRGLYVHIRASSLPTNGREQMAAGQVGTGAATLSEIT